MEIKLLSSTAKIPTRGSEYAAGFDLYADSVENINSSDGWSLQINPGETVKVNTGISIALPDGTFGGIYPRSGLATKQGLAPANKVGVVDEDYRGPVIVALYNHSNFPQIIHQGDRVAQLIIQPYVWEPLQAVEELSITGRGDGGFGSSGK